MSGVALAIGGGSYLAGQEARRGAESSANVLREQSGIAREDLAKYRTFGEKELADFESWQAGPGGQFQAPTMEEVRATPGYESRLGAIESSAAARGGLMSGNALRDIGEFGSQEYGTAYNRKMGEYMNDFNRRMQKINLGYGAAGGSAGLSQDLGSRLSDVAMREGAAGSQMYGDIGSGVAGYLGQRQGEQQFNAFLDRAYPTA
jgi:hypothetical protein